MGKLSTEKQKTLDDWAKDKDDKKHEKNIEVIDELTNEKVMKSKTDIMMETLQGELTEVALDEAIKKAKK